MTLLDRFPAKRHTYADTTAQATTFSSKISLEETKLAELQLLTQEMKAYQRSYQEGQLESRKKEQLAYEAQICTLKQALYLQQKTNLSLQRQIEQLKQELQSGTRSSVADSYIAHADVDYTVELAKQKIVYLTDYLRSAKARCEELDQENGALRQQILLKERAETRSNNLQSSGVDKQLLDGADCVAQRMYQEIKLLRQVCEEQRTQIRQLQELGLVKTAGYVCKQELQQRQIALTFHNEFSEIVADINHCLGYQTFGTELQQVLDRVKLFALDIAGVCAKTMQGEYEHWAVGVKEALNTCEQFLDVLGLY